MIINQHTQNFGDDCAAAAVIQQVREKFPQAKIDVVYHDIDGKSPLSMPAAGNDFVGHNGGFVTKWDALPLALYIFGVPFAKSFFGPNVTRLMGIYGLADKIFVSPCGANIGIYRDWFFLLKVVIAISSGHTPIFHLNTIGKSGDFIFDLVARRALRRSKVFVREQVSYDYLLANGIAAERGVDSAFALPELIDLERKDEIVVIPTDLSKWFNKYRGLNVSSLARGMADELGRFASEHSLRVRFVPHIHTQGEETEFLNEFARNTRASSGDAEVLVDDIYLDYRDYERRIASARLVVSMRYHGVVLAAKNAVPFVSVAYENKMMEVSRYSGHPEMSFAVDDWSETRFRTLLERAVENSADISASLKSRSLILRELAVLPVNFAWLSAT
jgi:polysaccharide pyruvyl transferase WcaK-like protein